MAPTAAVAPVADHPGRNAGTVTIVVCDPAGMVLRNRAVQIYMAGDTRESAWNDTFPLHTDAAGFVKVRWYPGHSQLRVLVPGIGFTATGIFELQDGATISPPLPRLAPFANIEGSIPKDSLKSTQGAVVAIEGGGGWDARSWPDPRVHPNPDGKWRLADVVPGAFRVVLKAGNKTLAAVEMHTSFGESLSGIMLSPGRIPAPPDGGIYQDTAAHGTSVEGIVTDASGRPVSGATVYASCAAQGDIREYQWVLSAKSDAAGRYHIHDAPTDWSARSVRLFATHAGYALGTNAIVTTFTSSPSGGFHADLVLPPANTGLTVRVLKDGVPVKGATVRLTPSAGTDMLAPYYRGSSASPERDALFALLQPIRSTDGEGRAHFVGIPSGLWDIAAIREAKSHDKAMLFAWADREGFEEADDRIAGLAHGVPLPAGRTSEFALNIYPQSCKVTFQLRDPSGKVVAKPDSDLDYTQGTANNPISSFNSSGDLSYGSFASPGIWHFSAGSQTLNNDEERGKREPYNRSVAVVALSPSLPHNRQIVLRESRIEPGSVRVRLVDPVGHPIKGGVMIRGFDEHFDSAGSTDDAGEIVFHGLPSSRYEIFATPAAKAFPADLIGLRPLDDAALTDTASFDEQGVDVTGGHQTETTLREEPESYLRGTLKVSGRLGDYALENSMGGANVVVDPDSGAFVAGPFRGKEAYLLLRRVSDRQNPHASWWSNRVTVVPGAVVHANLIVEGTSETGSKGAIVLKRQVWETLQDDVPKLSGRVFLADGVTPASGATVVLFQPHYRTPSVTARTDAMGRIIQPVFDPFGYDEILGGADSPIVVAWLPGVAGGHTIPYDPRQEGRITLPKSVVIHGKVTVGGSPISNLHSTFRILARYQDHGKLNSLLSIDTTAQADGTFVLVGLSPGHYIVQAARDGIWVSASQALKIGVSADLPHELKFDIPVPGRTLDLKLRDASGKPILGAAVAVEHRAGPLTRELWPTLIPADGTALVHIEGLPTGPTRLTVFSSWFGSGVKIIPSGKVLTRVDIDIPPLASDPDPMQKIVHCP